MATFKADQATNYGGQGGNGFFSIQKNKGTKQIRFMYNGIDDVEGMSVHKVKVGDKDRYVNCIRNYNDPVDACPFCRQHKPVQARLFIPVYNIEQNQAQIWDRGKTMFSKMSSICERYSKKAPLVSTIFEIERNGEPGDMKTNYEVYNIETDDTTLEDLPEVPQILGGLVLDKTADEMEFYLANGYFEDGSNGGGGSNEDSEEPVRRRPSAGNDYPTRRTPANGRGRRGDEF